MQAEESDSSRIGRWRNAARTWFAPKPAGPPRIGLALGGGFARGIAHTGVLKVLERNGIPLHCIAGVSAGAIVASAYAGGAGTDHIERIGSTMKLRDVARWTINRLGLAGSDRMISFLGRLLKEKRFEDMQIPLAVVATDLASGRAVVFRDQGDVIDPIRASCSFPGLFTPLRVHDRYLVDGFVSMEVPALAARQLGATHVISVHLPNPTECVDPGSMFSVVSRCFQVMSARMDNQWRRYSNVVITPEVADIAWDSFHSAQHLIELGERAALAALPEIRRWLHAPSVSAAPLPPKIGLMSNSSSTMKAG
jgi:NTE family protein